MKKNAVIVANGERPNKKIWQRFVTGMVYKVAADGGLRHFSHYHSVPDLIIGDLDSVDAGLLKSYENICDIVKLERQSDTDLEKTMKHLLKRGFRHIVIIGGTGGRLDHTLGNINLLVKYHTKAQVKIINTFSIVQAVSKSFTFQSNKGETVSFYGVKDNTIISSEGLCYEMHNACLRFGGMESTSNVAKGDIVQISIHAGTVLMVRDIAAYNKDIDPCS